jgi:hypothetical protein
MANNVTVTDAASAAQTFRTTHVATTSHVQHVFSAPSLEETVATTGGTVQHTVDSSPAVPLDPPNATALWAIVRCYEATQDPTLRCYYRGDGTTVTSSNATGYMLHGEAKVVALATFTNWQMIAESTGVFSIYVEWLTVPAS